MKKWLVSSIIGSLFLPIIIMFFFLTICSGEGATNNGGGTVVHMKPSLTQAEFIETLVPAAKQTEKEYGIFTSVTLGQAILESGWGESGLALGANNLFGIKAYNWSGATIQMKTQEEVNGGMIWTMAQWRAYNTWNDSIIDHGKFLKENSRYSEAGVFKAKNYKEQVEALKRAGYATDSSYVSLVCGVIECYNLNQYDSI